MDHLAVLVKAAVVLIDRRGSERVRS